MRTGAKIHLHAANLEGCINISQIPMTEALDKGVLSRRPLRSLGREMLKRS
jgi:hypothetical protein